MHETGYDESVLNLYVKTLLSGAAVVTAALAVLGGILGAVAGFAIVEATGRDNTIVWSCAIGTGVVLGILGWLKTYTWKIQAHELLLQMQIENHLRAMRNPPPVDRIGAGD